MDRSALGDGGLTTRMVVLGAARHGGTIVAAEAFAVAETCGRSSEQMRSCLRRLVSEGLFAREGVGLAARADQPCSAWSPWSETWAWPQSCKAWTRAASVAR
jgi:hypothetical protein